MMTSPAATLETATTLEHLSIGMLRASANNPRRTFDERGLEDLKASVAQLGIQEPLLVRSIEEDGEHICEIVSGHRRHRVAQMLGLETVPCIVRDGMTDSEAAEAAIVANLQRVDIHPVEEAQAFQALLEVLGTIPAVAARLGKEQSYVAKCLRLVTLTLPASDSLRAGLITIEHALLLARLAEAEQNDALKWCLDHSAGSKTTVDAVLKQRIERKEQEREDAEEAAKDGTPKRFFRGYTWEPQSVVRLKAWIEAESGILLSRAPWDLVTEDYLLPDVGPCAECPQNTVANSPLFGDLQMGEATCTDGACFAAKTDAFVQIEMRKAQAASKPSVTVPRLSWKRSAVKPSIAIACVNADGTLSDSANPSKVLKYGQWINAKPGSCKHVRTGVMVDWSDAGQQGYMYSDKPLRKAGETIHVCIAVGCKIHPKDWEKQQASADKPKPSETPEQREAREAAAKAYAEAERPLRVAFMKQLVAKVMERRDVIVRQLVEEALEQAWQADLSEIAAVLGIPMKSEGRGDSAVEKYVETAGIDDLLRVAAALQYAELLDVDGPGRKDAEHEAMEAAAKKLGFKWVNPDAKPAAPKKAAVKKAAKGQKSKPVKLSPEARKKIADNMKKRWAEQRKKAVKK